MDNHPLLLLLALIVIFGTISPILGCTVCVLEPLITSRIKCPRCTEKDVPGIGTTNNIDTSNSFSGEDHKVNWKTCSIEAPPCNATYKYRSVDGSCNNLNDPTQGMSNTVFIRHLPANYQDGKHALPLGSDGKPKPLARILSTTFTRDVDNPDDLSLATMQWGQVVAHDIILAKIVAEFGDVSCCLPPDINKTDICLPVMLPSDDKFYSQFNRTCFGLIRSNITRIADCNLEQPGQQYNNATHIIDGSLVYGSYKEKANQIREFQGGRLRTQITQNGRSFLPEVPQHLAKKLCYLHNDKEHCYDSGDTRVVQNPQIAALQNVLVRDHNRMADKLQQLHPEWDDETLYQETRAILVAIIQHITYSDWLQLYLGKTNMVKYKLYPKKFGYTEYNSSINLASTNGFSTAAFRMAHSGIQGIIKMLNYHGKSQKEIHLGAWMNRPCIIQEGNNYDEFLMGLANQPMQSLENYFTEHMTNLMFQDNGPYGTDLVSSDLQRGRDHGLAPYIHYLEICTGYKVKTFKDLYKYIPKRHVDEMERVYYAVEDIDMFLGGILERKVRGTRLGPTFLCLNIEQFYRKKWGDRFWYEVGGQPHTFTGDQLREIKKVTLSRLLCDNSDNITQIAVNSFFLPSYTNKIVPCSSIPELDLSKWK